MQANLSQMSFLKERPYNADMQRGRKPKKEAPAFGKNLAQCRKNKGLTQYEFADELGISRNLVVHYERSCENPTMDFVVKAANALNVSADELLGLKKVSTKKKGPSPRVEKLTNRLSELPKNKQSFVLEMIEGYINQASS